MGWANSDGEDVETRGDGSLESVCGRDLDNHGSGTASWDSDGNKYSDSGPNDPDVGERE